MIGLFGVLIVVAAVLPFDEFFAADVEVEAGGILETAVKEGETRLSPPGFCRPSCPFLTSIWRARLHRGMEAETIRASMGANVAPCHYRGRLRCSLATEATRE